MASTLSDINSALKAARGETEANMLSVRLMLSTGVNLTSIKPEQNADAALVTKVTTALGVMGIKI